jgi:hypothetical protein
MPSFLINRQALMASQKLTNCCVAAIALTASTYVSTPHCSTIARLAFGAFCLAIDIDAFLRKHQVLWNETFCLAAKWGRLRFEMAH